MRDSNSNTRSYIFPYHFILYIWILKQNQKCLSVQASILRRRKNVNGIHTDDGYSTFGGYNGGSSRRKLTRSQSQNNISSSLSDLSNLVVAGAGGAGENHRKFSRYRPEVRQQQQRGGRNSVAGGEHNFDRHNSVPSQQ